MSKILLINQDRELLDYYRVLLNGFLEAQICAVTSVNEGFDILKEGFEQFSLIVVDYDTQNSHKMIKAILDLSAPIPSLITVSNESFYEAKKTFKLLPILDYYTHYGNGDAFFDKIERLLKIRANRQKERVYCKVGIELFAQSKEVFFDVYLKISDQKYVKVLNRYDEVDHSDLERLYSKNIKHLYVRERDFSFIIKKLIQSFNSSEQPVTSFDLVDQKELNSLFSIHLQEMVSETVQKIGLNQEAVEMSSIAINSTMRLLEDSKDLKDIFMGSVKGDNYISEHSFLISFLTGAMLKESPYYSHENALSLTVAAFFHDVMIEGDRLAKIQHREEYSFQTLGIQEQEKLLKHPHQAVNLFSEIEGIPKQTIPIVENHHENYEGTGFPKGLDFKRISPLCALFNVAHELSLCIYDSGCEDLNLKAILDDMLNRYPLGNYAEAVKWARAATLKESQDGQKKVA